MTGLRVEFKMTKVSTTGAATLSKTQQKNAAQICKKTKQRTSSQSSDFQVFISYNESDASQFQQTSKGNRDWSTLIDLQPSIVQTD